MTSPDPACKVVPMTTTALLESDRMPTERLLTWSLAVAPVVYLVADSLYATQGWDSADAGGVHVIGAIAYAFVILRLATWSSGWLRCLTLFAGVAGACGNAAYGFNTIQVSLGGVDLVDTSGPGAVIKPLGLLCPLAFVLGAVVLVRLGRRASAGLVGVAGLAWPVAHIVNVGWLAVALNVLLVAGLAPLAVAPPPADEFAPRPES